MEENLARREGYLLEPYRYFHLRDTAGQELDYHFHEFSKLVILISGHVDYAVESTIYNLKPWDILLVPHHTIHKALIDKTIPYERIILYLDESFFLDHVPDCGGQTCFTVTDRNGYHMLHPESEDLESVIDTVRRFELLRDSRQFASGTLRDQCILELLIQLTRIALRPYQTQSSEPAETDDRMEEVLSYIDTHLSEPLSVEALAEEFYLSPFYFMRLFKDATGLTVHAYIRQKRLFHAAHLIRSGLPITKAASDSGFTDYSAFYRAFKNTLGITPKELKKQ